MATPETAPPPVRAWCGSVFGLTIGADEPLPGVPATAAPTAGRRHLTWRRLPPFPAPRLQAPVETLVDLRHESGEPFMTIERDAGGAFHVSTPALGSHVVAGDGSTIDSYVPRIAPQLWQRPFFAQVLP